MCLPQRCLQKLDNVPQVIKPEQARSSPHQCHLGHMTDSGFSLRRRFDALQGTAKASIFNRHNGLRAKSAGKAAAGERSICSPTTSYATFDQAALYIRAKSAPALRPDWCVAHRVVQQPCVRPRPDHQLATCSQPQVTPPPTSQLPTWTHQSPLALRRPKDKLPPDIISYLV